MNAPAKALQLQPPLHLLRKQPPAKFSVSDDAHLTLSVGDASVTLTPEDIRRLDRFMGLLGGQL